jgi:hypothetical protein
VKKNRCLRRNPTVLTLVKIHPVHTVIVSYHLRCATNILLCMSTLSQTKPKDTPLRYQMTHVASTAPVVRETSVAWVGERKHNEVHWSTDIYRKSRRLTHMVNGLICQVGQSLEISWTKRFHPRHLLGFNTKYNYMHGYDNASINEVRTYVHVHIYPTYHLEPNNHSMFVKINVVGCISSSNL